MDHARTGGFRVSPYLLKLDGGNRSSMLGLLPIHLPSLWFVPALSFYFQ